MTNYVYTTTGDDTAYVSGLTVTPSDSVDLVPPSGNPRPTRGIIVSGAGTIKMTFADGSTPTITIPAGVLGFAQDVAVTRIWATGTTATLITALY